MKGKDFKFKMQIPDGEDIEARLKSLSDYQKLCGDEWIRMHKNDTFCAGFQRGMNWALNKDN